MDSGLDATHRPGMTGNKKARGPPRFMGKTTGLFLARSKLLMSARTMIETALVR
jgi:hypothetical protein